MGYDDEIKQRETLRFEKNEPVDGYLSSDSWRNATYRSDKTTLAADCNDTKCFYRFDHDKRALR